MDIQRPPLPSFTLGTESILSVGLFSSKVIVWVIRSRLHGLGNQVRQSPLIHVTDCFLFQLLEMSETCTLLIAYVLTDMDRHEG